SKLICCENSALSVQVALFGFLVLPDADLVESVECSAVSKSLKTSKPRCFNVVGCSTLKVWFHKRLHHRCDLVFFVADS
ncbi:hypothetical protein P3565_22825, partial [Vibrio parahaemolyticus]|nr:hypothetical protein [Vibrio parahaemolyticus]